jgi:cytosine/adenosine deaminase-related metal-dependent hydrolase
MDLVIRNADWIVTANSSGPISGDIVIEDGVIGHLGTAVGATGDLPSVDARGCIVVPGLVNTHHHMFQSLTRACGHQEELFGWLGSLWGRWASHDADWMAAATAIACAELLLSGCTTTADHHYLPDTAGNDAIEAQAQVAADLGIRLVQAVGSMDVSDDDGGLAPRSLCESADAYLARAERLIASAHDPLPGARQRIALAPCHPLAVSADYTNRATRLARSAGVRLHTHVAEARDEEAATLAATGRRPLDLLDDRGFLGPDVWLAHAVHLSDGDIETLATSGTSVVTCPSSNLRLGSGIARVRDLVDASVPVGLGVDGSASNDSGNILQEARLLMLTSRAGGVPAGLSARQALDIATAGGAHVLGWPEIGAIERGSRGDLAIFPRDDLTGIGTESDVVAGLLLSPPPAARHVIVDGEVVVRDGRLVHAEIEQILAHARSVIERTTAARPA